MSVMSEEELAQLFGMTVERVRELRVNPAYKALLHMRMNIHEYVKHVEKEEDSHE